MDSWASTIFKLFWLPGISQSLAIVIALIALIIGFVKRKTFHELDPVLYFLIVYITGYFLFLADYHPAYEPVLAGIHLYEVAVLGELMAGFLLFSGFIGATIRNARLRRLLFWFRLLFLGLFLGSFSIYQIMFAGIDRFFLQVAFTVQAVFLNGACILYFIDTFRDRPHENRCGPASFWVVAGLSLFLLCTMPSSLLGIYPLQVNISLYYQLFEIFSIFYCLLFLLIIKAYSCKPMRTRSAFS